VRFHDRHRYSMNGLRSHALSHRQLGWERNREIYFVYIVVGAVWVRGVERELENEFMLNGERNNKNKK
jgi:hypothetical protein